MMMSSAENSGAASFPQPPAAEIRPYPLYGPPLEYGPEQVAPPDDVAIVRQVAEAFMARLHGTDRYTRHNQAILDYHDRFRGREDTHAIGQMAISMHDLVDHTILHPLRTAAKSGVTDTEVMERTAQIRESAVTTLQALREAVSDKQAFDKAYLYAQDATKWEEAGRVWRGGATERLNQLLADSAIDQTQHKVALAAVNKTTDLNGFDQPDIERILKSRELRLEDLSLADISEATRRYNVMGLYLKGLETLDNLQQRPKGNPASTYRDCIEALNFFVPALVSHDYRDLAAELRGAALTWLVDDPHGNGRRQYELSAAQYGTITSLVGNLVAQRFGQVNLTFDSRLKTEGSIREKLDSDKYKDAATMVPDGIGMAFIVPNTMEMDHIDQFARRFKEELGAQVHIREGHPHPQETSFESGKRKSGYEATHMTFFYAPGDGTGAEIPFEIQVYTHEQSRLKIYGPWSDLYYKVKMSPADSDDEHMAFLRGHAERELPPGVTIQSIAEMVAVFPELPSVFNQLFTTVKTEQGARLMLPHALAGVATELFAQSAELGKNGELTILGPRIVTEAQFLEAIAMFCSSLPNNLNVRNALSLVQAAEKDAVRNDGVTNVVEGHLLPAALWGLMMAMQSGSIMENDALGEKGNPDRRMANVLTTLILHDYVESYLEPLKGHSDETIQMARRYMLFDVEDRFGFSIRNTINAITAPIEIRDKELRRTTYREQILSDAYASLDKPADRWHNHLDDLTAIISGEVPEGSESWEKARVYFAKTDAHLSQDFTSSRLPALYTRTHWTVWQLARKLKLV
jgi:hypothetical protein